MATSLSSHSVKRLKERANVSSKREAKHKAVHARKCGYSPADFKGAFKDYLMSKAKSGKKVKVHCEFIYIFDGTRLVTSYEVPKKYKGKVDSYLVSAKLIKNKDDKVKLNNVVDVAAELPVVDQKVDKTKERSILRRSLRNQLLRGSDRLVSLDSELYVNSIYGGYTPEGFIDKNRNYINDKTVSCFANYVMKKLVNI